ncbi:DUF1365 domain-containing protein [Colwellia sp. MEBiC06753]
MTSLVKPNTSDSSAKIYAEEKAKVSAGTEVVNKAESLVVSKAETCAETSAIKSAEKESTQHSAIFTGNVRHRRYTPKSNAFNYRLYMLGLDVDEVMSGRFSCGVLGRQWFKPIRVNEKKYLRGEPGDLRTRITAKVLSLGGVKPVVNITMLVQAQCLGLYFSPANFYFCYDQQGRCIYMLTEVSNTPWNKRHYYLVDMVENRPMEKDFHVSPFMDLAMQYHWRVKAPKRLSADLSPEQQNDDQQQQDKLLIHIENKRHDGEKLFDATLALSKTPLTVKNLLQVWLQFPVMTLKVVAGIYYQALKLFAKGIAFVPYQVKKTVLKDKA